MAVARAHSDVQPRLTAATADCNGQLSTLGQTSILESIDWSTCVQLLKDRPIGQELAVTPHGQGRRYGVLMQRCIPIHE
jgi:hypothetical protein